MEKKKKFQFDSLSKVHMLSLSGGYGEGTDPGTSTPSQYTECTLVGTATYNDPVYDSFGDPCD